MVSFRYSEIVEVVEAHHTGYPAFSR
jgi:hypothetical protein